VLDTLVTNTAPEHGRWTWEVCAKLNVRLKLSTVEVATAANAAVTAGATLCW